jgi:hypothetical protein
MGVKWVSIYHVPVLRVFIDSFPSFFIFQDNDAYFTRAPRASLHSRLGLVTAARTSGTSL